MSLDMTESLAPKSDQANADDFVSGPRTFTIAEVREGNSEQPFNFYLAEFPSNRPYKPGLSMRRVMTQAWGPNAAEYVGRRLTLYTDPSITFGKDRVGGIRISHMSHLPDNKPLTVNLTKTRGKREPFTVQPLPDDAPSSPVVSDETLRALVQTFELKGIPEEARLAGVNQITGGKATDLETITEQQALDVLESLKGRPDA